MRLIELRLKNLNSLKGEWHIDFSDKAFMDEGIFAITGQTGAGKTTILDAICLALYGATPRLGEITSTNDVMTRQTGDCYAEVVIDLDGAQYRCRWGQHRAHGKPDGNLQSAMHEVAKVNLIDSSKGDEILESAIKKTKNKIIELTSMDFQQFTRSILLAQGSFSAFLKAKPEERADILEKITGTQIYAEISINTHEKYRLEKEALERMQALSNSLPLLDADTETQYRDTIQNFNSTLTAKKATLTTLETQLNWLNEVANLQAQLSQYESDCDAAKQAKLDFAADAVRLDNANKALEISPEYKQLNTYRQQLAALQSNKQQTQQHLQDARGQLAQSQIDLNQTLVLQTSASDNYNNALPLIRKTRQLDGVISQHQQRLQDQQAQKNKLDVSLAEIELNLKNHVAAKQQTQNELDKTNNYLAVHPHYTHLTRDIESFHQLGKQIKTILHNNDTKAKARAATQDTLHQLTATLAQLEHKQQDAGQHIVKQKLTVADLKQQLNNVLQGQTRQSLRHKLADIDQSSVHLTAIGNQLSLVADMAMQAQQTQAQLPSLQADRERIQQSLNDRTLTLASLNTEYDDKKANVDLLQQVAKLEDFIHLLQEGAPCPLCGSIEHPYRQHHPLLPDPTLTDNSQQQTPIAQLNSRLSELKQQIEHLQTGITNDKITLATLTTQLTGYDNQLRHQFKQTKEVVMENKALLTALAASLAHYSPSIKTLFADHALLPTLMAAQAELIPYFKGDDEASNVGMSESKDTLAPMFDAIEKNTAHASLKIQTLKQALIHQKDGLNTLLDDQDTLTQHITDAEQQLQTLEQQALTATQDINSVNTDIQLQNQQLNHDTATIAENFNELSALTMAIAQLSATYQADDRGIGATWATLNTALTQINKAISHKQVFSEDEIAPHLHALRAYCQWLQQQQQHYDTQHSLSQNISTKLSSLSTKIAGLQQQQEGHRHALSEAIDAIEDLAQTLQTLQASRQTLYQDKDMDAEENRLRLAMDNAKEALSQAREQHHSQQQRLEYLQAQAATLEKELDQTDMEVSRQYAVFSALIKDNNFADEASFKAAVLERDAREVLSAQQQSIDSRLKIATHNVEATAAQLQLKQAAPLLALDKAMDTDIDIDNHKVKLTNELTAIADEVTELNRQMGAIEQQLKTNDDNKLAQQAQLEAIEKQKQQFEVWRNLRELIGSADGKKYRTFAQGLTFQMMVSHANTQLQKMSDRYLLTRDEHSPLELNVIDGYQGSLQRSTKNLSGGEGFIISLALALGLSNMASQKIRVDSLFLDEGFGTLDEDSLDIALDTLTNLQAEGKLIGVISHVQALKERIYTQIKVEKISGGHSQITGAGCRKIA